MPNVKIYVDDAIYPQRRDRLVATLAPLRDLLCREFAVDVPACQFALMPVAAMPDLPRVNVEMAILPRPERTRERILSVGRQMREILEEASGTHVAIRVTALDPETYVAMK